MSSLLSNVATDVEGTDYCVFGLATCFTREEGEVKQIQVIEPIPSAAVETLAKGIATSYTWAKAMELGAFVGDDRVQIPGEFPAAAHLCENFTERAIAATRTYQKVPTAKEIIPMGTVKNDFNHSTERKRVLNAENIVSAEDNVKQHSHTHKVL